LAGAPGTANTGLNIADVNFTLIGDTLISDCNDQVNYGFGLVRDLNGDCRVNLRDLKMAVEDWTLCNNPDPALCF
jgi:hypothetical protein